MRNPHNLNIDVLCGQEHNFDISKYSVTAAMFDSIQKEFKWAKLTIGHTPTEAYQHQYKPGGTMILSWNEIVGQLVENGVDDWGRWSFQTFAGKHHRRITLVSCYQVVASSLMSSQGTATAASQQFSVLRSQRGDTQSTPREAFKKDLHAWLKSLRNKNHEIILAGDFTEAFETSDILQIIADDIELVDFMKERHHHLEFPNTYARGRQRINLSWALH